MTHVAPIDELVWLYHAAAGELGYRAIAIEPSIVRVQQFDGLAATVEPGWVSPPTPAATTLFAARRQRSIRDALLSLDGPGRAAIDAAYGHRHATMWSAEDPRQHLVKRKVLGQHARGFAEYQAAARDYGVAAGAVLAALSQARTPARDVERHRELVAAAAADLLIAAHRLYLAERARQRDELRQARQAARNAGRARREALLSELLDLPRKERVRARARAWMEELGVKAEP